MKYLKLYENFGNVYWNGLALAITKTIKQLKYDLNREENDIADLLHKNGISKPMSARISHYLSLNMKFDPTKVDHYVDEVMYFLMPDEESKITYRHYEEYKPATTEDYLMDFSSKGKLIYWLKCEIGTYINGKFTYTINPNIFTKLEKRALKVYLKNHY